tara:strand:+ start:64 stop:993 length:930 start_codon:yes stop_codon:yes gene_type:complete
MMKRKVMDSDGVMVSEDLLRFFKERKREDTGSSPQPAAPETRVEQLRILTWNPGSICPQSKMVNKLDKIRTLLQEDDIIFLPEASLSTVAATREKQLLRLDMANYTFSCSTSGRMAVYVKASLAATVELPGDEALRGAVAVVKANSGAWAAVGVYAPNMRVSRAASSTAVDAAGREAFDEALFGCLAALHNVPTLALVGDFNLVWESTGGGAHGNLRQRWHDALQNFEGPLDHLDPDTERVVPTTRHYPRNGVGRKSPPDARVDFLFVRNKAAVDDYGRHDRFWRELAWPAEGQAMISEHTPLWLVLKM